MGRGEVLTYAFPRAGIYTVRAKITNATSTHGSASASQSLEVTDTFQDNDRKVGYDGWTAASAAGAKGGYRVATDTGTAPRPPTGSPAPRSPTSPAPGPTGASPS